MRGPHSIMLYWLITAAAEHPLIAVVTALGALLSGIAAVIDARHARDESTQLRTQVINLDKRVAILENK